MHPGALHSLSNLYLPTLPLSTFLYSTYLSTYRRDLDPLSTLEIFDRARENARARPCNASNTPAAENLPSFSLPPSLSVFLLPLFLSRPHSTTPFVSARCSYLRPDKKRFICHERCARLYFIDVENESALRHGGMKRSAVRN